MWRDVLSEVGVCEERNVHSTITLALRADVKEQPTKRPFSGVVAKRNTEIFPPKTTGGTKKS
jgi:hypothetical protein